MHRLIVIAVLIFWAILFGGFAHLSLSGSLSSSPHATSELQLFAASAGQFQIMAVLLMVVAALFGWAVLALIVSDDVKAFREVEAYSYAAAIFMMSACSILALANLGLMVTLPSVLVAALAVSAAGSQHLSVMRKAEIDTDLGRTFARRMALGAAHNSMLTRVSGRPLVDVKPHGTNISIFPIKPTTGGTL